MRKTKLVFSRIFKQYNTMTNKFPIESTIKIKLEETFKPSYLKIINESYMHNVPKDAETHFKIVVVSDIFNSLTLINRHRKVNDTLKNELQQSIHALSIIAKTPNEWSEMMNDEIEPSPNCRGGFGK